MSHVRLVTAIVIALAVACGGASASPVDTARAFVASLSATERAAAVTTFDDPDRRAIRYTPGRRGGLALKDMDAGTRAAADALLDAALSTEGRTMAGRIVEREAILGRVTGRPDYRDPDLYYLAIFGEPGAGRWGWRFEGHHLSINLTYAGGQAVSAMPLMIASNPERTDVPGAPPELLGPLVETAASASVDPAARGRLIAALTAHAPEPLRSAYREALMARGALSAMAETWRGFDLSGGDTALIVETNQPNHIHITFRDARADFGG